MVDRTIAVRLRAEIADFKRKMGEAASVVDKNAAGIDTLSNHVGLLGGALTGFAALAVSRFAQFDKQMSSAQAATRATGAELDSLRQAAIRAGADTQFSAAEAAAGIENLAKAGVSTTDILNGGLTGALNLAAAGELEVAEAAEIAATAITQFKLQGSDVGHVADVLAAGAGKAQGGVQDMALALKYAGVPLAQLGVSFEETSGAVALFAKNGILGEQAGTSLRSIISSLTSPSAAAAKEMETLGINVFDAQGEFIGLEGVAGQLESRLGVLTEKERAAALGRIFGNESLQAANVLYDQGAAGIAKWTAAVDDQGYAAEQARIQNDNLLGDLERLGGSFDSVLIQSGSGANDSLRGIVQAAEAAVDALGQIPAPVLQATAAIAGAGGLALLGVAGLGKIAVSAGEVHSALKSMNVPLRSAVVAGGGLSLVLAGVGAGLTIMAQRAAEAQGRVEQLAQTWDEAGQATSATTDLVTESLSKQTNRMFDGNKTLIELADQVGVATSDLTGYIEGEADAIARVDEQIAAHSDITGEWIGQALNEQSQAQNLKKELGDLSGEYVRSKEVSELDARAKEAGAEATGAAADATQDATDALRENSEALDENWKAQLEASGAVLSLRDAESQAEAAYDNATQALKDNGKTLDVTTEKGRANRSALDQIASSGYDLVDSLRASGASLKDVQGAMATARERFIATAESMGMGERAANRLADELGLIPKNVTTTATVNTGNALAQIATLDNTLNRINGKVVRASVVVKQYGQAALATGGRLPGFPTGGRLPGTPPGNPMQDNLLGVDGTGMPKVRVRSREWVVNQPAADYYGDGIMGALNARAIPRDVFSGLLGLARGGEVGAARQDVLRKRRAVEAARAAWRRSRTDRNEDRLQRARDAADEARARYGRLLEEQSSVSTQLRRGEIRDSVSGGLSGALGVTDQLRDLAGSGDVSRSRERRLNRVAGSAEKSLTNLYRQAEQIDRKIASATDRFEKWKGIADGVSSSISGAFSLGDVSGGVDPWSGQEKRATGSGLLAASQAYQAKARNLVLKLRALQDAGYGTAILQEVAAQGVEGGVAMADALLQLSPADAKALQASQKAIDFYADRAGIAATDDKVTSAQRALEIYEAQAKAIDKNIGRWAKVMGRELARALGIKARASGGPILGGSPYLVGEQGPELVVPPRSGYVLNATKTANALGGSVPTYTFNITNIHPVNEPASVTTNRALATAASTGRF